MKPKNRVFCPDCGRPKMLFKTEKEALGFIKWNGDDIDTGGGKLRPYYCAGCCGYHITSHEHNTKFDGRLNRMIERYKRDVKTSGDFVGLDHKFVKELDEKEKIAKQEKVNSYLEAIDISKLNSRDEAKAFLDWFFNDWDKNDPSKYEIEAAIRHEVYVRVDKKLLPSV